MNNFLSRPSPLVRFHSGFHPSSCHAKWAVDARILFAVILLQAASAERGSILAVLVTGHVCPSRRALPLSLARV